MDDTTQKGKTNTVEPLKDGDYHRSLKDRHVQFIALGGIIGSGYFLGTGEVIHQVGPAVFLAYILGGLIIYLTMLCMGELAVAIPISGSFINYTSDFISPTFACGVGWSYWISWVVYIPAECVAGGIIMEHFTGINGHLWAIGFGIIITYVNLSEVGMFGEIEFWLALIKIVALFGFIAVSGLIFFGFIHGNHPDTIIFGKYLFHQGGFFPNGKMVLLTAMVLLLVNYQGSEIIGLAAGESIDPEKMIPKAVKNVTYRIIFVYIVPVLCLVTIYPWNLANIQNSVFADALHFYDLRWAGFVTSIVTLTATLSCCNSGVYGTVRSLNALARNHMAPKILAPLNSSGVPQNAGFFTLIAIWILLGLGYYLGQSILYIALLLVSGFTGTVAWISLCWAQINFRKKLHSNGYQAENLRYRTPGSPYTGLTAIFLMIFSLIFLFFNANPTYKISFIIGCLCIILPMIWYKFFNKNNLMDNDSHSSDRPHFDILFPPKT